MEKLSTKRKGDISELRVFSEFISLGFDVYIPFGENTRCDMIADIEGDLQRIQVKTGRYVDDKKKVEFNCSSTTTNFTEMRERDYKDDVDAIVVFFRQEESFYYIPIEDATKTSMVIRLVEPENSQTKGINMAEDYLLSEHLP